MSTPQKYDAVAIATSLNEPSVSPEARHNRPEYSEYWHDALIDGIDLDSLGIQRNAILRLVEQFTRSDMHLTIEALNDCLRGWMDSPHVELGNANDRVTLYHVQDVINLLSELQQRQSELSEARIRAGAIAYMQRTNIE